MNRLYNAGEISIDRDEALRYLGYKNNDAPDEKVTALMDMCEKKLLAAVNGKFVFRVFNIKSIGCDRVSLENCSFELMGMDICRHLKDCSKVVLLTATAGAETDKLIRAAQASDMAEAVVTDAMASCAVEAVCNRAEEVVREEFADMYMTWRFSPGYGDMPIELQKRFTEVTNSGRMIGVCADENSLLTPKKSVTAVIGLSDKPIGRAKQSCACCNMRDRCAFRKSGARCAD